MNRLAPEIIDSIIDYVHNENKKEALQSLSLVSKRLRNAANRKKFNTVHLTYGRTIDNETPGEVRYYEDASSRTFKFLQLVQESVDIPAHIRTLTFAPKSGPKTRVPFPPGYENYLPFTSITILRSMAYNLQNIGFPAGLYDEAALWNLDVPEIIRNAFIDNLNSHDPTVTSKVDVTGIQDFPVSILRDIRNIDELFVRPFLIRDTAPATAMGQSSIRKLRPKKLALEVPWGLDRSLESLVQLFKPPSSFADLTRLDTLNISYFEPNLTELNKLLQPCAPTLKHIYIRVGSLTNGTTTLVDRFIHNIQIPFTSGVPDLSCLVNLKTLTIVGLIYIVGQGEYSTQVYWLAQLLRSLTHSPSFTSTLRELHLCFTLGRIPVTSMEGLDFEPITHLLADRFAQSHLEQISFNFRVRDEHGVTRHLDGWEKLCLVNNHSIRPLQTQTGIVVVNSDVEFRA